MIASKDRKIIASAIKKYITGRKEFFYLRDNVYTECLRENDNIIGIIGEYYVILYLESIGKKPKKAGYRSQKGYDLLCFKQKIFVKVILTENQRQRASRLTGEWDELILILLDKNYRIFRVGTMTKEQHNQTRKNNSQLSKIPYVSA